MSALASAPERAGQGSPTSPAPSGASRPPLVDGLIVLGLAAGLAALAFLTSGSADPGVPVSGSYAGAEIALTLLGAGAVIAALVIGGRGRIWGGGTVALFAAFTALAALSILWSVQPDWAWYGANQLACYLAVLAGAAALARTFPERWPALLGGVALAMVAVTGYALLAKVFPASLGGDNTRYGRLQEPFGYWNAVGACAALGLPALLWLAARRGGGLMLRALSLPGLVVLLSGVALSYSRSAALMAIIGVAGWLAFAPLRLRSIVMLAVGAVAAVPVVAWAQSHHGVSGDNVPIAVQDTAGHTFGVVLLVVLVLALVAGAAAGWALDGVAVPAVWRRRAGTALVVMLGLVPVAGVAGVAASHRGLTGEISHAWTTLTSSGSKVGDTSTRLTQLGSSRPVYWHEGLQVGEHALLAGAGELGYGIARVRYATKPYPSHHAHSYLIQTFADLGLIGVGITLALTLAWLVAAGRALEVPWAGRGRFPWAGRGRFPAVPADGAGPTPPASVAGPAPPASVAGPAPPASVAAPAPPASVAGPAPPAFDAERAGLIALAAMVVAFGFQSLLDWTWYFAGVAVPVLVCAGWLAGRGPLGAPVGRIRERAPLRARPGTCAVATGVATLAVIAAWLMWQPQRSAQALAAAQTAGASPAGLADARAAVRDDPLSVQALLTLAAVDQGLKDSPAARSQLAKAVLLAPEDPDAWAALGSFDVADGRPRAAISEMNRVLALDRIADADTAQAHAAIAKAQAALATPGG